MKVYVALSGGVDSAIAAFLLDQKGYEVKGIFLKLLDDDKNNSTMLKERCAKRIAERLNIPFEVLDVSKEFKKEVIDYFIVEYINGKTPNPCVTCNQKIKINLLLSLVKKNNCDLLATGHYVRLGYNKNRDSYYLHKGVDQKKDQSYFLYRLKQSQLKRLIFPLGTMQKFEVKELARKKCLEEIVDQDSQEICFVNGDYRNYITTYLNNKSGSKGHIMDLEGKIIGEHKGIFRYTVGQRKGLEIRSIRPYYVAKIDYNNNIIYAGEKENCYKKKIIIKDLVFTDENQPVSPLKVITKIRYNHLGGLSTIYPEDNRLTIEFDEPQLSPTPGQSAVFYNYEGVLIGGGIIS
ncbi:MAG: tRNA 2-thiouridine(34) synthase MnmA [bacterium]